METQSTLHPAAQWIILERVCVFVDPARHCDLISEILTGSRVERLRGGSPAGPVRWRGVDVKWSGERMKRVEHDATPGPCLKSRLVEQQKNKSSPIQTTRVYPPLFCFGLLLR